MDIDDKSFDSDHSTSQDPPVPVYEASELFQRQNEFMIRYEGELYRIRITRNGKLIMNK